MMHILSINTHASIQDLGRTGFAPYGVGRAGAMDEMALQAGNLLLGNAIDAPAIEVILGSMTVQFSHDTPFCLTGALYEAYLDDELIHSYWRYTAKAGQKLTLIRARVGVYGYLCVKGGILVSPELGSCSTDVRCQLGGTHGGFLKAGEAIPTIAEHQFSTRIGIVPIDFRHVIHAVPSAEYEAFSRQAHYAFWQNRWQLQSNSNRMGYRLKGNQSLTLKQPLEMLSHAIQIGMVQVPPDGQPIVLMADAQTTGGYPKIACVVSADVGRLAQVRFGEHIQFRLATPDLARKLRLNHQIYLNHVRRIAHENP